MRNGDVMTNTKTINAEWNWQQAKKAIKLKPTHIPTARRHLRATDPVMKSMIDAVGPYTLRFGRDRIGLLVRSIISEQISTGAARAIRKRLMELVGPDGLTAENLGRFTVDELRSVGLSPQKASYVADLATKVNDGTVDLRQWGDCRTNELWRRSSRSRPSVVGRRRYF